MAYLLITVDAEGCQKVTVDGRMRHLDYADTVERPVQLLLDLVVRSGLKLTFFLPLGELLPDYPQVADLVEQILTHGHDIQAHRHLPFPKATEAQIVEWLGDEVRLFERYVGYRPVAIRAGGYAVGRGAKWINAILTCGFRIDSSVWAGANTENTVLICDEQKTIEEGWWGPGALEFDFRGAPIGGAYFCKPGNLAEVGNSPLLELPISLRDYDEVNPWQYKFDPQWQDGAMLVHMARLFADTETSDAELFLNMSWHSSLARYWNPRILRHMPGRINIRYPMSALRAFKHFVSVFAEDACGGRVHSLRLRDVNPSQVHPCVVWGRQQAEYWVGQPGVRGRPNVVRWQEVAASTLCPICRTVALQVNGGALVCPECEQVYPVIQDIPVLLSTPYLPGEFNTVVSTPVHDPPRRKLLSRVTSQQPVSDAINGLLSGARWIGDAIKSFCYVGLALVFTPWALWRVLRGYHRRSEPLAVPPQQVCKIVGSMRDE